MFPSENPGVMACVLLLHTLRSPLLPSRGKAKGSPPRPSERREKAARLPNSKYFQLLIRENALQPSVIGGDPSPLGPKAVGHPVQLEPLHRHAGLLGRAGIGQELLIKRVLGAVAAEEDAAGEEEAGSP